MCENEHDVPSDMRLRNGTILPEVLPNVCGVQQDNLNLQLSNAGSNSDESPISELKHGNLPSGNSRASPSIEWSNNNSELPNVLITLMEQNKLLIITIITKLK